MNKGKNYYDEKLIYIAWASPLPGDHVAVLALCQALADLRDCQVMHTEWPLPLAEAFSVVEGGYSTSAVSLLCWVDEQPAADAWAFHVEVQPTEVTPNFNACSEYVLWPRGEVCADSPGLHAALQIMVLLVGLRTGDKAQSLENLIDTLLRGEAWTLASGIEVGGYVDAVVSASLGAGWLTAYRVLRTDVYIQRALEVLSASALALQEVVPAQIRAGLKRVQAEALMLWGLHQQDEEALQDAASLLEQAAFLVNSGVRNGAWANIQITLGHVRESLAELEVDDLQWGKALDAYGSALSSLGSRQNGPVWVAAKLDFARALSNVGRKERDVDRLLEAVQVLDEIKQVYSPIELPGEWANVMRQSGLALQALGQIHHDSIQLVMAVQAFESALREQPRESQPLAWAMTKHQLAKLWLQLGLEQADDSKLRRAIEVLHEVLTERTITSDPKAWATSQRLLGHAYQALSRHVSGVVELEQALDSYTLALSQCSKDSEPLTWGSLQSEVGQTWLQLAHRLQQTVSLKSAASAFRAALSVLNAAQDATGWFVAARGLATALHHLAVINGGQEAWLQASQAYRCVLRGGQQDMRPEDLVSVLAAFVSCQRKRASLNCDADILDATVSLLEQHLPRLDEERPELPQSVRQLLVEVWLDLALEHERVQATIAVGEMARVWLANTVEPPGSSNWNKVQAALSFAQTWSLVDECAPQVEAMLSVRQTNRALLTHVNRQNNTREWAIATGHEALCDWLEALSERMESRARAAQAVLMRVLSVLWRVDSTAAPSMERALVLLQGKEHAHW